MKVPLCLHQKKKLHQQNPTSIFTLGSLKRESKSGQLTKQLIRITHCGHLNGTVPAVVRAKSPPAAGHSIAGRSDGRQSIIQGIHPELPQPKTSTGKKRWKSSAPAVCLCGFRSLQQLVITKHSGKTVQLKEVSKIRRFNNSSNV